MGSAHYPLIKVLRGQEPYLDKNKRMPKEQAKFLVTNNNMKGITLGAALDSCRWGSMMTVMYEMTPTELVGFIENWMWQNRDNFENMFHEMRLEELYSKFELPHINYEQCPTSKDHKKRFKGFDGKLRCIDHDEITFKKGYVDIEKEFDKHAQSKKRVYNKWEPQEFETTDDHYDADGKLEDWAKRELEISKREVLLYDRANEVTVKEQCNAVLSDKNSVLSLETIIRRLNISPENDYVSCRGIRGYTSCIRLDWLTDEERKEYDKGFGGCAGHTKIHPNSEFTCDGWDLAFYVQKWYQQSENPPIWMDKTDHLGYKYTRPTYIGFSEFD